MSGAQKLTSEEALSYLQKQKHFTPIQKPTEYMAGFETDNGRQIALVRNRKDVAIFVEPGDWTSIVPGVGLIKTYEKKDPSDKKEGRHANLKANAPRLSAEYRADYLSIPTMEVLSAFCNAYGESNVPPAGQLAIESVKVTQATNNNECEPCMNTILYGPPGTGKTFKTAEIAVNICDGKVPESRQLLMERYEELRQEERISFVTFHQSYGYEDFIEGLRPELKDGQVSYRVRPGIFREACDAARLRTLVKPGLSGTPLKERTIYKMSLGRAGSVEGKQALQASLENGYVVLGWGEDVDFSECKNPDEIRKKLDEERPDIERPDSQARFVSVFKDELKVGDIIIVSQGNSAFRAVAEVTGDYEFLEAAAAGSFHQMRAVRWLAVFEGNRNVAEIYNRSFVMSSLYKLDSEGLKFDVLDSLIKGEQTASPQNYVLIIDEINRANISKVFGELITLLEPDKREGKTNAITVKLPYSGDSFSMPSNLYVVGTMNTADRSIALLDTALRRRFEFEELQPAYETLPENLIEGVDLRAMLQAMNDRIEYLYDRDHTIGHAYFIHVKTLADLEVVFRRKVIPLLQEYFYENWSKVQLALNDNEGGFIEVNNNLPKGLELVTDGYDLRPRYRLKDAAFSTAAYLRIYQ